MTAIEFLERCWVNKLNLEVVLNVPWHIIVTGGLVDKAFEAEEMLRQNRDLEADVIITLANGSYKYGDPYLRELIAERQAMRAADGLPGDARSAVLANMQLVDVIYS